MGFQLQVSQCEFNYDSFWFRELDQHSYTNNCWVSSSYVFLLLCIG